MREQYACQRRTGSDKTWVFQESSTEVHMTSVGWVKRNLAGGRSNTGRSHDKEFGKPFKIFELEGDTIFFTFLKHHLGSYLLGLFYYDILTFYVSLLIILLYMWCVKGSERWAKDSYCASFCLFLPWMPYFLYVLWC